MSGNIELQNGSYQIEYSISCGNRYNNRNYVVGGDEIEESYKKLAFNVRVLPPNEMKIRDFAPDELFFIAPPEKRRSQAEPEQMTPRAAPVITPEPALAYAAPQEPAPQYVPEEPQAVQAQSIEAGGRTKAMANLRDGPSKQAATFIRLPPNLPLYVVEQVGSWYKVQLRTGDEGYVHQSLIVLQ